MFLRVMDKFQKENIIRPHLGVLGTVDQQISFNFLIISLSHSISLGVKCSSKGREDAKLPKEGLE